MKQPSIHGPTPAQPARISIIIPFWSADEIDPTHILAWTDFPGILETILVGAPGSSIPTKLTAHERIHFLPAPATGRGIQLNTGAAIASGDILLFHHLDTVLTPKHTQALTNAAQLPSWTWGAFYRKFDHRHPGLRWLEGPERLHCRWFGSLYGDQSLFARCAVFLERGGFADIPLMEDIEFSDRMRRSDPPLLLDPPINSSPRRHLRRGPWKTTLNNLLMIARYRIGACPRKLHSQYYAQPTAPKGAVPHSGPALRCLLLTFLLLTGLGRATPKAEPWEADYAALLRTYAMAEGVRYEAWHSHQADRDKLAEITRQIAANGPSVPTRDGQLAYYLNAYNIWMLSLVLQAYPIDSVRDIAPLFGVFTGRRIEVANERMSLNHLEKQIIIARFKEPRIHFALNCASASCPPLLAEPFTSTRLEKQLQTVTRNFLQNPGPHSYSLGPENRVRVSKIFDWYRRDFEPPGIIPFINFQRSDPLPDNLRISFLDYDWSLNRAP
ncbi:MAG: hypothetical protein OHK005_01870 [Candidatus Methylacidiphilales bacterium]